MQSDANRLKVGLRRALCCSRGLTGVDAYERVDTGVTKLHAGSLVAMRDRWVFSFQDQIPPRFASIGLRLPFRSELHWGL